MTENDKLQMFEDQPIRTAWDEEQEEWYFSIVDAVAALTEQTEPRKASTYWAVMKKRLKDEGADELLTNCKQLKMRSPKDGKRYKTDVANTEQLLRIIQSIPADVKSWTTFFTNKFEKKQKNKPYKAFSRYRTALSLVGLNCYSI